MNKTWNNAHYQSAIVSDEKDGWTALDLTRRVGPTSERIARVVFWDSEGQFSFEMYTSEIPLIIVEDLIAEAKQVIPVR